MPTEGVTFSEMTHEELVENGRKGGKASGEAKRRKKAIKETLEVLLTMPIKNGKAADIEAVKNFGALRGKNVSVQEAMMLAMLQSALKGDVRAAEFIRDTAGQKPVEQIVVSEIDQEVVKQVEDMVNDETASY